MEPGNCSSTFFSFLVWYLIRLAAGKCSAGSAVDHRPSINLVSIYPPIYPPIYPWACAQDSEYIFKHVRDFLALISIVFCYYLKWILGIHVFSNISQPVKKHTLYITDPSLSHSKFVYMHHHCYPSTQLSVYSFAIHHHKIALVPFSYFVHN